MEESTINKAPSKIYKDVKYIQRKKHTHKYGEFPSLVKLYLYY